MKARLFICLFKPKAIYCRCFINQQVSSVMAMYNNIFKITHNDVLPAQGSILISEPFLQDAYFQRSVVLLVEHTQEGSMGFVLNKKTELSVNTFFADLQGFPEMPIYLGGPVSANRLFFIHSRRRFQRIDTLYPERTLCRRESEIFLRLLRVAGRTTAQ